MTPGCRTQHQQQLLCVARERPKSMLIWSKSQFHRFSQCGAQLSLVAKQHIVFFMPRYSWGGRGGSCTCNDLVHDGLAIKSMVSWTVGPLEYKLFSLNSPFYHMHIVAESLYCSHSEQHLQSNVAIHTTVKQNIVGGSGNKVEAEPEGDGPSHASYCRIGGQ